MDHSNSPASNTPHATEQHAQHVNPWLVFAILAVMTVVEVGLSLLGLNKAILTPLLIAMSLVKAGLVALYYMHLRYEKLIYAIIFVTPTIAAVLLITTLLTL